MKQLKLIITVAILSILIKTSNAQIQYFIDSITTNPQFTTQENIPIRIDGRIYSSTYGVGDSTLNIVGDTVFIFIEFKNGFGSPNDNWTVLYNLPPMTAGNYIIKCEAQILVPLHSPMSKVDSFQVIEPSEIDDIVSTDKSFFLQNYPNPVTDNTVIKFKVDIEDFYDLIIYDTNGREVRSMNNVWYDKGDVSIPIETKDMSNGIYFYALKSLQVYQTRKMIIQK